MLEEDLQILIDQTDMPRDLAKKLLIQKKGDLVESILEFENSTCLDQLKEKLILKDSEVNHVNDDVEKPVDVSSHENLKEYREIVDEKDTIYNFLKKKNEEIKKKEETDKLNSTSDDVKEKRMCNEMSYYATRKNNINSIKVL